MTLKGGRMVVSGKRIDGGLLRHVIGEIMLMTEVQK